MPEARAMMFGRDDSLKWKDLTLLYTSAVPLSQAAMGRTV